MIWSLSLWQHDDLHIAAAGCAVCILVPSLRMYYQRRRLGADGSGGILVGAQRDQRTAPPTASDWGDAQCVWRTRFSVTQIHLLLAGLDMFPPNGSLKTYGVCQNNKLY